MTVTDCRLVDIHSKSDLARAIPTLIDLFSGCGGMSIGFKQAGFKIILAADIDSSANQEYEKNLGITPKELELFEVSPEQILNLGGLRKGDLDVLVGCPPCQGFTQLRRRNKPYRTNNLVIRMAELAAEINPKFVVFENVPGVLRLGKDYFGQYLTILETAGYHTVYDTLQAADYGVPQFRKRVIAISTRIASLKKKLSLPTPTYCDPKTAKEKKLKPWRTVRDAIGHLPSLQSGMTHPTIPNHSASVHSMKVLKIIQHIPHDGGSRKNLPKDLWLECHKGLEGGAENIYGRMSWDSPSLTISSRCNVPACGRFIHPEQDRGMTVREALLLQSFPMYYEFATNTTKAALLVGNAMPVRFARRIAQHIAKLLRTINWQKGSYCI